MTQKKNRRLVSAGILLAVIGVPGLILYHEVHHYLANRKLLATVGTGDLAAVRSALDEGADPDMREDPTSVREDPGSPLDLLRKMFLGSSQPTGVAGGTAGSGSVPGVSPATSQAARVVAHRQPPAIITIAVEMGQSEIVKLLLERGANPNTTRPSGMTLLMTAASRNQPDVIKALLDRGARIEARARDGRTALTFAIVGNHVGAAQALMRRGASLTSAIPPAPKPPPASRLHPAQRLQPVIPSNPLELAFSGNSFFSAKMVQLLLDAGCDARAGDKNGRSLLALAMMGGMAFHQPNFGGGGMIVYAGGGFPISVPSGSPTAVLQALIAGGADVNAVGFGRTPLQAAAQHGWADAVSLLLAHGANARAHSAGTTPALTLAAQSGSFESMKLLLAHGADAREAGPFGNTALMGAAQNESVETVRLLLAHGADASAADRNGQTALNLAIQSAPERMFTYVKGVTQFIPPSPQEQQRTNTAVQIIRLLLAHGANVNARDRTGKTALTLAQPTRGFTIMPGGTQRIPLQAHRPEIIAALKAAGAK